MKNKNTFYIIVLLIIIFGIAWYLFDLGKAMLQSVGQTQNNQNNEEVPKPPEIPKFIMGSVSRVEGQKVFIKVGTEEKIIITDEKTEITSQVREGGIYKDIPVTFSDIKISSKIIVYYIQNSGLEYKADKVRILKF